MPQGSLHGKESDWGNKTGQGRTLDSTTSTTHSCQMPIDRRPLVHHQIMQDDTCPNGKVFAWTAKNTVCAATA